MAIRVGGEGLIAAHRDTPEGARHRGNHHEFCWRLRVRRYDHAGSAGQSTTGSPVAVGSELRSAYLPWGRRLLERGEELALLRGSVRSARGGSGRALAIEGAAGIGKTALLRSTRESAEKAGLRVLVAQAREIERDLAWGLVRELFEPALRRESPRGRAALLEGAAGLAERALGKGDPGEAAGNDDATGAALHGLYWLTVNLSERSPVLVAVDDVHWADVPSLRWLAYLAARVEDLPVLVAITIRSGEPGTDQGVLPELVEHAQSVRPPALSAEAASQLVREALGEMAEDRFCAACHSATRGNPFLLRELLSQLRHEGTRPTDEEAERVLGLHPESVGRSVLLRLARLSHAAIDLARAVAVLGGRGAISTVARLAGLKEEEATDLADDLVRADILAGAMPLDFVHPLVRAAVYAEIPPVRRGQLHARAAELIAEQAASPEEVAGHLMAAAPRADPTVVASLREAADVATARGAPETAIAYLRRAVAEPPDASERAAIRWRLGLAESSAGDPAAAEDLAAALELTRDPVEYAHLALDLGRVLTNAGRLGQACDVIEGAIERLAGRNHDLELRLEAEFLEAASYSAEARSRANSMLDRLRPPDRGGTPGERLLLARLAFEAATGGGTAAEAIELARRALADGRLLVEETAESQTAYSAADALMLCDEYDEPLALYDRALADARERGSVLGVAFALLERAYLNFRRGAIPDAETDARETIHALELAGWDWGLPAAAAFLIYALIEQGRFADAEEVVSQHGPGDGLPASRPWIRFRHARGRLRIARGQIREGLDDLLSCGRSLRAWNEEAVGSEPWRASAAPALLALGQHEEARRLAAEQLRLARHFGAPRSLGIALHTAGLVAGDDRCLDLLGEAVAVLEPSPARLDCARALCELGAAIRRAGRRRDARQPLRMALDLAGKCGATALAERARAELLTAGARPRRDRVEGRRALTASELRIAEMAAAGKTNREIAQGLFLSLRTVETHLTHAYQKLDIASRAELGAALRAAEES